MTLPPRRSPRETSEPASSGSVKSGAVSPGLSRSPPVASSSCLDGDATLPAVPPPEPAAGPRPPTIRPVRKAGLEPAHPKEPEPKSGASASSATCAQQTEYAVMRSARASPAEQLPQEWLDRSEGVAAVGDRVLLRVAVLRQRAGVPGRDEDRVVAEAVGATRRTSQPALDPALAALHAAVRQRDDGSAHERGAAVFVRHVGDLLEQEGEIGAVPLLAARVRAGRRPRPASGEDAWRPAEDVDGKARVVGDGREAGGLGEGNGLEPCVAEEGHLGLSDVRRVVDGAGAHHLEVELVDQRCEDLPQLVHLVLVASREDQPAPHPNRSRAAASRAARWRRVSSSQPVVARSRSSPSIARSNGSPSAVPCTSTNRPSPVMTRFRSVWAPESSG